MSHWNSSHEIIVRYWEIGSYLTMRHERNSTHTHTHSQIIIIYQPWNVVIFGILYGWLLIKYSVEREFRLVFRTVYGIKPVLILSDFKSHFRSFDIECLFWSGSPHQTPSLWAPWERIKIKQFRTPKLAETIKISWWKNRSCYGLMNAYVTHSTYHVVYRHIYKLSHLIHAMYLKKKQILIKVVDLQARHPKKKSR